ncbi:MAG: hypothetical protein U5K29_07055 [Acidimicrobiales bacterium]|nr:hypothetical protein [Acidimicrobiales bacterium]
MSAIERAINALARDQHGVVAYRQITALGGTADLVRRRMGAGHWHRASFGVYRIGAAPKTLHQRFMVAVLSVGPDALLSHRAAARMWGIAPTGAVPIEVSVPRGGRNRSRRGMLLHATRDLDKAGATHIDGIPVTSLARTLLDLGGVEPSAVRPAMWEARRRHGLEWDELLATLVDHGRPGRDGIGPLRQLVAAHYGEVARDSRTEDHAFVLMRDSGRLPQPKAQVKVMCADGVPVTIDFGWPHLRCYLEIFGGPHFASEDLIQLDLHRRNQIELAGNALLIHTGRMLEQRPDQFVTDVAQMLRSSGWDGDPGVWSPSMAHVTHGRDRS